MNVSVVVLCDALFREITRELCAFRRNYSPYTSMTYFELRACAHYSDVIYLPNWERGQPAALDVTVISPLQSLTLHRAASSAGHALTVGEQRKVAAHAAACHAVGVSFVPLVFETLGGMSELASTTVSRIGRLLGQRLGISPADTTRHLFQRCSISLWRGNAALWLRRFPTRPPSIDSIV